MPVHLHVLQYVAVCCSVSTCSAVCVLTCGAVCGSMLQRVAVRFGVLRCVAVRISVLCKLLAAQSAFTMWRSVAQCDAVCCSVLQSVDLVSNRHAYQTC